jgi:hypothetical protein
MKKWEYKIVLAVDKMNFEVEEMMCAQGLKGWECFQVIQNAVGSWLYFKREIEYKPL